MSIANYSTGMAPDRSAAAITKDLVKAGARGIASEYDNAGRLMGLSFAIQLDSEVFHYTLPVRVDAVHNVLKRDRLPPKQKTREHAGRLGVGDGLTTYERWDNQRLQIEHGSQ